MNILKWHTCTVVETCLWSDIF